MAKRLLVAAVMLAVICSARAYGEEKAKAAPAAKPAKQAKVVEQRIHEGDMGKIEHMISKAVVAKQGTGNWEYTAKRMKPPKNEKWEGRWNEMGAEGWEAIDHFDNVYIFKRPALASSAGVKAVEKPADTKADEKAAKEKAKEEEKAAKEKAKAEKKAQKDADKAAKQAEKEAKKAAKETKKKGE
jgi:hypothetical protein